MKTSIRFVGTISITSAENWRGGIREAMISIRSPHDDPVRLRKGWAFVLRLCFHDIGKPVRGGKLFSETDAGRVIRFLDRVEGKVDAVYVHCSAGVSRSPAIARFISQRYGLTNAYLNHPTFNRHVYRTLARCDTRRRPCSARHVVAG